MLVFANAARETVAVPQIVPLGVKLALVVVASVLEVTKLLIEP